MIEVKNLTVKYGATKSSPEVLALKNISLKMEHGHFNVILGVSGSGKTTLLRTIAGLMKYEGQIIVDGHDYSSIPTSDRNLAMVAQNFYLYPHLTVFDNIAFPLKVRGAPRKEIIDSVYELAELFEIKFLLNRKVKELSGGQQQRVALLRAIIKKPELYLFDEPLSNVSLENTKELPFLRNCALSVDRALWKRIYTKMSIAI